MADKAGIPADRPHILGQAPEPENGNAWYVAGFHAGLAAARALAAARTPVDLRKAGICICWWTPPETWLSAWECGYGSGYEPGSQMEPNPDCPVHLGADVSRETIVNHSPNVSFGVQVRSVSMTSPWGEEAVWASVPTEVADQLFALLGPPDLPFIDNNLADLEVPE